MNVLSLFDGISAGQIALERAGIKVDNYFASEIDKNAIKVTQHHYPKTIQLGDIRNVKASDLPHIDLVMGGSPCQDLSKINVNGKGLEGIKSSLFYEYLRLRKEINPKYWFLENVQPKQSFELQLNQLMGVSPYKINSNLVSAQNRGRAYWTNIKIKSLPKNKHTYLYHILETDYFELYKNKVNKTPSRIKMWEDKRNDVTNKNKANCLLVKDDRRNTNLVAFEDFCRYLTPLEQEKLQTLPINYTNVGLSRNQRVACIGNSWTVDIIVHFFKQLNQINK